MTIDTVRLGNVFDPTVVSGHVVVIGCGALGSAVALQLAKLGLRLTLVDGDVVESHNLTNQLLYRTSDIGQPKAGALARELRDIAGSHVLSVNDRFEGAVLNNPYVFCCVDSMASRKMIFDACTLRPNACLVEGRIGVRDFSTFLWDRSSLELRQEYAECLYSDDEVSIERAPCGTTMSIGATAQMAASMMVWQFMDFTMNRSYNSRVDVSLDPMFASSRRIERT